MATLDWKLDMIGTLELEDDCPDHIYIHSTDVLSLSSADRHDPGYSSLVILSADLLIVIDNKANTLRLHSCSDGKLLALSELLSGPQDVCLVNGIGTQVAVAQLDGCITILSVESAGQPDVIKIRQLGLLDVTSEFKHCYGLRALKSGGKLAVSGSKWDKDSCEDWICWGLVSVVDGHVSTVYKICRGAGYSYLHTSSDDSTVYISCNAGYDSEDNGVYAFNVADGKKKFFYFHRDMKRPEGITVDRRGFIYVCNWYYPCIYQLTPAGKLVTVHSTEVLPWPQAMYCGEQQEKLYITNWWSNEIRTFLPVGSEKEVITAEVLDMDTRYLQMHKEVLQDERETVYNIRVLVVGSFGAGKTTLIKRLLGKDVDISDRMSTEGIDVHTEYCRVTLATGKWTTQEKNSHHSYRLHRLAKVINEKKQSQFNIAAEEQVKNPSHGEITPESNVRDLAADFERHALVTVSDFAGQNALYTTHQMLLTQQAIYLMVLDVSEQITDHVDELTEIWLNSIHCCATYGESSRPPVILIGTHADQISQHNRREVCERYFRNIRSSLKDNPSRFHLVVEDFVIDNTVVDNRLEDLKKKIVEVASQQPYWGEEIPSRWLLLEQQLMRLRDAGVKVISYRDMENLNKEGTVSIRSIEELDLFLRYLHETGTVIYFSIEVLRESIVLDPQWFIDALKTLINAQPDLPEPDSPAERHVSQKWSDFKEKGILTVELIDAVWTKERNPELHAHRDHILMLMEKFNIIFKPRSFIEIVEKVEHYFLIPCMLHQESPREVISPEQDPMIVSTPVLCFSFTGKFLPSPIFHRLLVACVARWPVAKRKRIYDNLIFSGCCVFDLDLFNRLTLHYRSHVIFARITRMVIDEVKTPDAKLCARVRKFITLNLSKITSYLGQNLQFEVSVSGPLDLWYTDEGIDPDIPITPEHMNHARLCVALLTVCGNAMRDILLTYIPVPYKDIYQALLANKVNLTRRQGRPLLNPDQTQLVFPDPQGQTTGTVDQFDLSLLYILIRNVSTVPPPVTGWGYDPPDQPRDISLGASVERIRSYRNHIIGFSPDGKSSHQDFEDYWNKIEAVLYDIEAVIGSQIYSRQLEKQKRQVISINEAC